MEVYGFKDDKNKEPVLAVSDIVDKIYPVGSIYQSTEDVDPGQLFGGTWVKISGYFLRASSSAYPVKSTGGQNGVTYTPQGTVAKHALTISELPAHTHKLEADSSHSVLNPNESTILNLKGGDDYSVDSYSPSDSYDLKNVTSASAGAGQGHSHSFSGQQVTLPNVPPYYTVNTWRRTA